MGDMLSQEEINALFGAMNNSTADDDSAQDSEKNDSNELDEDFSHLLGDDEKDILGEIGNISMGTSASTLYTLLNQRVDITTPRVRVLKWSQVAKSYDRPCVGIRVNYVEGIEGASALILKERDVKIISDLMMGGDGLTDPTGEINDLDLSAIAECMNQMIGSSSTSLASLIKTKIDIDTPVAFKLDFNDDNFLESVKFTGDIVACISFRMEIGNLIDSEIMQIWPIDFAKEMVEIFMGELQATANQSSAITPAEKAPDPISTPPQAAPLTPPPADINPFAAQPAHMPEAYQQPGMAMPPYGYPPPQGYYPPPQGYPPQGYYPPPQNYYQPQQAPPPQQPPSQPKPQYNAQPVQFESFDASQVGYQRENIEIIKDVPLEVTVELGRTNKKIKEILEFAPGTIVELNKIAGETVDVLINGKFVAKGEVVVIEENFAVKITDIISAENII